MAGGVIAVLSFCEASVMHGVISVIALIAAWEFHHMARSDDTLLSRLFFVVSVLAIGLHPLINSFTPWRLDIVFPVVFLLNSVRHLAQPLPLNEAASRLAHDVLGLTYLGCTLPFILLLRGINDEAGVIQTSQGGWILLMVIVVTALSDTGGYFAGRFFGKRKLYEAVSPKKTIEGAVGGFVCAVAGCFAMQNFIGSLSHITTVDCIAIGSLGTFASIVGDLVESLIKRGYGVKDSGTIIPGHGGVLDRIDALLFSAPVVFLYWGTFIA